MGVSNQVVISALLGGKAGNNMFQYAFFRSFAESRGLGWRLWERPGPKYLNSILPSLPLWDINSIPRPSSWTPIHSGAAMDESLKSGAKSFESYFQDDASIEAIDRNGVNVRRWFLLPESLIGSSLGFWSKYGKNVCCFNVRGGDYINCKAVVPEKWYPLALECAKSELGKDVQFISVTDDREYASAMLGPDVPVFHFTPAEDFGLLLTAPNLVCSNSTFCWWAAFLNPQRPVFAPRYEDRPSIWRSPVSRKLWTSIACPV